jgi:hypothetical protein
MELILIATYTHTQSFKRVTIKYFMDNSCEYVAAGEVSDSEIEQFAKSCGADVAGWNCELRFE